MTIELEKQLQKEFPFMSNCHGAYQYNYEDKTAPVPCECNDGWYNIIYELCQGIQKILSENNDCILTMCQVKEKFGSLCFYYDFCGPREVSDKIDDLIDVAEGKSIVTCEWCGKPGKMRKGGWMLCLCDECENNRRTKK